MGNWSTDGCVQINANSSNLTYVTCHCDHLTNFAFLVVSNRLVSCIATLAMCGGQGVVNLAILVYSDAWFKCQFTYIGYIC